MLPERYFMNLKTFYVSDPDGTLMRNDETISAFTVRTVNDMVASGLAFTYATARSVESARKITGNLNLSLPVVTGNGAVLADNATGRHIEKAVFTESIVSALKHLLPELLYCGFVSCFLGDRMIRTTVPGKHTSGLQGYLDYYTDDPSLKSAGDINGLFCGKPGYVTIIGKKEEIRPIYEKVRNSSAWESFFQKDTYRDEYWLEICPRNCTKAKMLLKVKEKYGFDRLVVFGDSLNDLSMFMVADEAYAMANVCEELKKAATWIIGSNEEDSVAYYLSRHGVLASPGE